MITGRSEFTSTLLTDGTVLIVGGNSDVAEIYDPVEDSFTSISIAPCFHGNNAVDPIIKTAKGLS